MIISTNANKKYTLAIHTSNAIVKNCQSIFFTQIKLKNKKSPMLQKNKTSFQHTVQTLTDTALNVNRFG